ncbi:MAG: peptide chain release factor aRF-1 [Thermoplasmata archaeon]
MANTINDLAKYEFKRKLEDLRAISGKATELISLYIPPNKVISDVASYLRDEYAQSSNIKSQSTRKNVMAAISSILSRLKQYKYPPENGMVFFVGHKSITGDLTDMVAHTIEPPEPVQSYLYRCDSKFYLTPLEEMLTEKDCYGLITVDRSEAAIGFLRGKRIEVAAYIPSRVPSKHGRGGQSQRRFERIIEIAAHEFFKKVGDTSNSTFLQEKNMKGILVGGPGATKKFFVENNYLHHELTKKVIEFFDTGYTNEWGLRELVEKAAGTLTGLDLMREKKIMQRFMEEIVKSSGGLGAYGEAEIRYVLEIGAVDTLLLSEGLRMKRVTIKCQNCNYIDAKTLFEDATPGQCPKCSSSLQITGTIDLVGELSKLAEKSNSTLQLISNESDEGKMLLKAFGGAAAILRFSIGRT